MPAGMAPALFPAGYAGQIDKWEGCATIPAENRTRDKNRHDHNASVKERIMAPWGISGTKITVKKDKLLKKISILLVDDDDTVRDSLRLFFHVRGAAVNTVQSAEAGIAVMRREDYDVLMADYSLPGMNGLEFMNRARDLNPHIRRILMSSCGHSDIYDEAMRIGIENILEKPFNNKTVSRALDRIMNRPGMYGGMP